MGDGTPKAEEAGGKRIEMNWIDVARNGRVAPTDIPRDAPDGIEAPTLPSPVYGGGQGGGMVVTITGATEQQIRQALSKLPDGADYTIQR
jgi:hypothetical protein